MKKWMLFFITAVLVLAACGGGDDETAEANAVTGTVTYLERIALPEDAVVRILIQNASLADAPPEVGVLAETVVESPGQVPIPFSVPYDPAQVDENSAYVLFARIEDSAGTLLFINTQGMPVLTHGSPTENVEVVVQPIGGLGETVPPAPATAVTGNVQFDGPAELPDGSTARIMIQNVSIADAPPEVSILAEQFIPNPGQFPIPFTVAYDPANVQENVNYALYARIEDVEGNLLYLNTNGMPVLTQGNPATNLLVVVEAIAPTAPTTPTEAPPATAVPDPNAGSNSPTAAAAGLTFRLVQFGPPDFEREIIPGTEITAQFTATEVTGFSGCNTYQAQIIPRGNAFVLGAISTTQLTCDQPEGIMKQERDYLSSLQGITAYQYQYQSDGSNTILGLQLFYPLATGGNGALTYFTQ